MILVIFGVLVFSFYGVDWVVKLLKFILWIILLLFSQGDIVFSSFDLLYSMLIFVGLYSLWFEKV